MSRYDHIVEVEKGRYDHIVEVEKFNPYHDSRGRFSTADGAASFTYAPGKSRAHDLAIQREKERHAARAASAGSAPKKGLVDGLGEEHAKAIEKLVQANAPQEVKDLWAKYGDGVGVYEKDLKGRGAYMDHLSGKIHINIEDDSNPNRKDRTGASRPVYETTMHESGHAIDNAIRRKTGDNFAVEYNGGEFEATLKKEANAYIKAQQKKMAQESGEKVPIADARKEIGKQTIRAGYVAAGDVSDMLEGATNGNFRGVAGHGKSYWTGAKTYWGRTQGHSVATEAFAEMFSASTTNPASLKTIKEVFPDSYNIFLKMCKEASQ